MFAGFISGERLDLTLVEAPSGSNIWSWKQVHLGSEIVQQSGFWGKLRALGRLWEQAARTGATARQLKKRRKPTDVSRGVLAAFQEVCKDLDIEKFGAIVDDLE